MNYFLQKCIKIFDCQYISISLHIYILALTIKLKVLINSTKMCFRQSNRVANDYNCISQMSIASEQMPSAKKVPNSFVSSPSFKHIQLSQQEKRWLEMQQLEKVQAQNNKQYLKKQDLSGKQYFQDTPKYAQFLKSQLRQYFQTSKNHQITKRPMNELKKGSSLDEIKLLNYIQYEIRIRTRNGNYQSLLNVIDCYSVQNLIYNFDRQKTLVKNLESILFKFRLYKRIVLSEIEYKNRKQISSSKRFNEEYLNKRIQNGKDVFNVRAQITKDFDIISKRQLDAIILNDIKDKNTGLQSPIHIFQAIFIYLQQQNKKFIRTFIDPELFYVVKTARRKTIYLPQQNTMIQYPLRNQYNRKEYQEKKQFKQNTKPRGLKNLGNTCYMNSGLQCLHKTKLLAQFFNELNENQNNQDPNFLKGYKQLTQELSQQQHFPFTPNKMKDLIAQRNCLFEGHKQHDCSQLINSVIDNIHKALNSVKTKGNIAIDKNQENEEKLYNNYKKRDEAKMKSIMDDIFFGRFRTSYHCCQCNKQLVLFQKFSIIYLPISSNSDWERRQSKPLQSCISKFQQEDIMEGKSSWTCTYCNSRKKTIRKMKIYKTNKILIFGLKRFQDNSKVYSTIKYPSSLDVKQLGLLGEEYQGKQYELYAVVNHFGSLNFGHYTAYCRVNKNEWFEFNDSFTYQIAEKEVLSQSNAYLLFYELQQK